MGKYTIVESEKEGRNGEGDKCNNRYGNLNGKSRSFCFHMWLVFIHPRVKNAVKGGVLGAL